MIAVEVDGAIHLAPERWIDDQLRQNEVVIGGTTMLRYPSVVVRDEPLRVVEPVAPRTELSSMNRPDLHARADVIASDDHEDRDQDGGGRSRAARAGGVNSR